MQLVLVTIFRNFILLVTMLVFAILLIQDNKELADTVMENALTGFTASRDSSSQSSTEDNYTSADSSELVIEADHWGQFSVDADIGGREIRLLVDTGAYSVALSQDHADTLGYPIHQLEYSGYTNTANGVARTAPIIIDEITIGDNVVRDVPGIIVDSPMKMSLLGMTFLRKLSSYEVKGDQLFLRW